MYASVALCMRARVYSRGAPSAPRDSHLGRPQGEGQKGQLPPPWPLRKIAYFSKLIFIKFILKKGIFLNFGFKFLIKLAL